MSAIPAPLSSISVSPVTVAVNEQPTGPLSNRLVRAINEQFNRSVRETSVIQKHSENTPTERRVLGEFMSHAGLSFHRFVDASQVAVHDWYHRLEHLSEPDRDRRQAVDETKLSIEDEEVYVWAAVNVDTFEVLHVDVSPGRTSLDALLIFTEVLTYCRGQPAPPADRGDSYDWLLDLLECDSKRETWGDRSLIEA